MDGTKKLKNFHTIRAINPIGKQPHIEIIIMDYWGCGIEGENKALIRSIKRQLRGFGTVVIESQVGINPNWT